MNISPLQNSAIDFASNGKAEALESKTKQAKDIGKIRKLAEDFEAMFVEQMLKGMRTSVQKSGLIDGGNAEEIYTSMLDSEYAKTMAGQRSTGLADLVERQLLQSMGVKSDISANSYKKNALRSYDKISGSPLQDGSKPVTMELAKSIKG
jgi:flagellar protein FlgJ